MIVILGLEGLWSRLYIFRGLGGGIFQGSRIWVEKLMF